MASDMAEDFAEFREWKKAWRMLVGVKCPRCNVVQPKRNATILMPGWRCKVDGYQDPRPRYVEENTDG